MKCYTCNQEVDEINDIPDIFAEFPKLVKAFKIPCSQYHVRCTKCYYPIAKNGSTIFLDGSCEQCNKK